MGDELVPCLAVVAFVSLCEWAFDLGVLCALILGMFASVKLIRSPESTTATLIILSMPFLGCLVADRAWRNCTIGLYSCAGSFAFILWRCRKPKAVLFLAAAAYFAIALVYVANGFPTKNIFTVFCSALDY